MVVGGKINADIAVVLLDFAETGDVAGTAAVVFHLSVVP